MRTPAPWPRCTDTKACALPAAFYVVFLACSDATSCTHWRACASRSCWSSRTPPAWSHRACLICCPDGTPYGRVYIGLSMRSSVMAVNSMPGVPSLRLRANASTAHAAPSTAKLAQVQGFAEAVTTEPAAGRRAQRCLQSHRAWQGRAGAWHG